MASPQCEDGYTKIANELLDAMCRLQLSGQQWKVLHAIIRKTYGWNQKTDWISGSQIAEMTGMGRADVCQALRALRQRRIILHEGKMTGVQKDYTMWLEVAHSGNVAQTGNIEMLPKQAIPLPKQATKCCPNGHTQKKERHYTKERGAPAKLISDQIHPAVRVYAELTGKQPRRGTLQYDSIARTVTDNNGNVEKWRGIVQAWLLADYRSTNVGGMLDWFTNGIPNHRPGGEKTQQQAEQEQADALDLKLRRWNMAHGIGDKDGRVTVNHAD